MRISQLLKKKGTEVTTVRPEDTVANVVATLAQHRVGALVVSADGETIAGIISERDVVRGLAEGVEVMQKQTSELMTSNVVTCTPEATTEELMATMTEHRFRHMPVTVDGKLAGIVSIGDIVNARVTELEIEREQLTGYISGR
ncbi:MAG: CBS domain-containing protein [Acidimicrobiales bacterium]|nr:CBS domain-containing protein [Acidimicrobiales bacterium]